MFGETVKASSEMKKDRVRENVRVNLPRPKDYNEIVALLRKLLKDEGIELESFTLYSDSISYQYTKKDKVQEVLEWYKEELKVEKDK